MNLQALNREPSLSRTPIGVVTYRRLRNGDVVACVLKRGAKRPRIVFTLEATSSAWDALYGKAPLEAPRFNLMMQRKRYEAAREAERLKRNASQTFRADLGWLFRRHPDLQRAIAHARAGRSQWR